MVGCIFCKNNSIRYVKQDKQFLYYKCDKCQKGYMEFKEDKIETKEIQKNRSLGDFDDYESEMFGM
jgi:hypothetical protein